tara:strand:- start:558 stop:1055 length:498 start_codon:yes stop_codon:yes gene_type:complete
MNILKSILFASVLLISLVSCNSDDEPVFQDKYTSEDFIQLHGADLKEWRIMAFYDDFNQKTISSRSACFTDDIFVFQKGTNEIQVTPGEVSCSNVDPEDEITTASYEFYEQEGLVFISINKASSVNGVIKNTFFSLQLVELSDSQMIFASGEKGNYQMALVFVVI